MQTDTSYVVLIDGPAPDGAELHRLPPGLSWEDENHYRTIRVTRTNGSRWYCRATLPGLLRDVPVADKVAAMPDGRTFCTGYYVVERDEPAQFRRIMAPHRVVWSKARDAVFFFGCDRIVAFGHNGFLWDLVLPGADPETNMLFDFLHDGQLHVTAQQWQRDPDGEPVFMRYAIEIASGAMKQWPDV